jgi:2-polyprenyl-6-hydroxyphenyl methylase/3-demethylubiquinone-9 3-methyltransferase
MSSQTRSEYLYTHASSTGSETYLWPALADVIAKLRPRGAARVFDLGCGNGQVAGLLADAGLDVTGVDTSRSGIVVAAAAYPQCRFAVASAYEDLAARFGQFPIVVSLEVVEHLSEPRHFARTLFDLVEPGGTVIVSTPYHGYLKNLALAVTGRMDRHFTALWDGGHIKFFSIATLRELLQEAGFTPVTFVRVGRIPPLAKSMMAIATRPL